MKKMVSLLLALALVLIGTITDAPATAVNVTGDTGLAMIIARFVEGKDWMKRSDEAKAAGLKF